MVGFASVVLCAACSRPAPQPESLGPHDFRFPEATLIAHALGHIEGHTYTNSVEALEWSLARGARFFEVDLSFTADGDLVCFHSGLEKRLGLEIPINEVTTADFLGRPFDGLFTVMTLESLVRRLQSHPEVLLITDCKHDFNACMNEIVDVARSVDPAFLGRIVPQFYTAEQWLDVALVEAEHGPFATVIFTLYRSKLDDAGVVEVASQRSLPVITMSEKRFNQEILDRLCDDGVDVLTHTFNKPHEIVEYIDHGVRGVYSDRFFTWDSVQAAVRRGSRSVEAPVGTPRGGR